MRLLALLALFLLRFSTSAAAYSAAQMVKDAMATDFGVRCNQPGVQCLM